MLYFPYILLLMAMLLVIIERVFLKVFNAGSRLDKFYSLLGKQSLDAKTAEGGYGAVDGNQRDAEEVRQSFEGPNKYFCSYVTRLVTVGAEW